MLIILLCATQALAGWHRSPSGHNSELPKAREFFLWLRSDSFGGGMDWLPGWGLDGI